MNLRPTIKASSPSSLPDDNICYKRLCFPQVVPESFDNSTLPQQTLDDV